MEPIAIVGMGCRFPGAPNLDAYWRLLRDGVDAIREVPADRWDVDAFYDPERRTPGTMNTRWGGFLDGVDRFDHQFFGISPREARFMDPQQRLLLEVACEALEHGGQPLEKIAGSRAGVFVGICTMDYTRVNSRFPDKFDALAGTGGAFSIAANRLSYLLNLRGPSLAVDTACSSSLVALHLACQSLLNAESDLALVGGVNLLLAPDLSIIFCEAQMLSPDGRCRTFDSRANGYVRGEGCGVVVLKRLTDAQRDKDTVLALIPGSALNQDGRSSGLTAPNGLAQEEVLRTAYARAGVQPGQIDYVEAHGTATPLGDPIEVLALGSVLAEQRPENRPCLIGSVKTNIGHLEAAAGIAGVIKVVLALMHHRIPPSLHFEKANTHIPFETLPVKVQQRLTTWPKSDGPALAGVSSFGFGGTNAHIVLQGVAPEPLETGAEDSEGKGYLLALSARSSEALEDLALALSQWLRDRQPLDLLANLAFTTGVRRNHYSERLALVAHSHAELMGHLESFGRGQLHWGMARGSRPRGRRPRLAFVFSGQGPQWWAMGQELLKQEPVFRATIQQCDALLRRHGAWSLLDELAAPESASRLGETEIAQPALFALQVALANLWRSWGITADAVVGHSVGEVAAAHVAGVLSLEEAVRIVFHRARLMQQATGQGQMAAVELTAAQADQLLQDFDKRLSIAAINSPTSTVLSGESTALTTVLQSLEERQVFYRRLPVNYAFHCSQMEPFQHSLQELLTDLVPQDASVPIYSTVTGARAEGAQFDARYWGRNLREPVHFAAAIEALVQDRHTVFLEISPHPVLGGTVGQCLEHLGKEGTALPSLRRKEPERATMLASLGKLYTLGFSVDWSSLTPSGQFCSDLPLYAWQRERHWVDAPRPEPGGVTESIPDAVNPLLGHRLSSPLKAIQFQSRVSATRQPFLADHQLHGVVVVPGASYLSMAIGAATAVFGEGAYRLQNVLIHEAFTLFEGEERTVQLVLEPQTDGSASFQVCSSTQAGAEASAWKVLATGEIAAVAGLAEPERPEPHPGLELEPIERFYQRIREAGLDLGPCFQGVQAVQRRDGEALGHLQLPETLTAEAQYYQIHPVVLDSCLQVLAGALPTAGEGAFHGNDVHIPVHIEKLDYYAPARGPLSSHVRMRPRDEHQTDTFHGDYLLSDESGRLVLEISGLLMKRASRESLLNVMQQSNDWFYEIAWQSQPLPQTGSSARARGGWLVLSPWGGVGAELTKVIEECGESSTLVFPSGSFAVLEDGQYTLNPEEPTDFARLLQALAANNAPPYRGVVYLWSLADEAALTHCARVLHLVQALLVNEMQTPLWIVTRATQATPGTALSAAAVEQNALWGLGRVIAMEHPEVWGGLIDLDAAPAQNEAAQLFNELQHSDGEDHLAFRADERLVARLVRSRPGRAAQTVHWEGEGSYLITGGLGSLGLKVAQWLAGRGARSLVLVGRSAPTAQALLVLDALRQREIQITTVQTDIADAEQVKALLAQIEALPPLRGIVHAAGVLDDGLLLQQTEKRFDGVLDPKVRGAWHLHALTEHLKLDFFVLFSSAAALLGSPSQGNYAAANACLDALAHHRRSLGLSALSINWGPWAEGGMAASLNRQQQERFAAQGIGSIAAQPGLKALEWMLDQAIAQVGVLPVNWARFVQPFNGRRLPSLLRKLAQEATSRPAQERVGVRTPLARELREASADRRRSLLTEHLRSLLVQVLGLAPSQPLALDQPLNELGLDSLMTTELKRRVEGELGVTLPVVVLLQNPSLSQLAERLAQQIAAETAPDTATAASGATGSWLVYPRPNPTARLRLFCFHYLGGGASTFRHWPEGLPEDIEVCGVQLPGREERIEELAPTEFFPLVETLAEVLAPHLDRPFAFYGHSMGALISFELARALRRRGKSPVHLFAAAYYAPHLETPSQRTGVQGWTNERLRAEIPRVMSAPQSLLDNTEFMQALLPTVKADACILSTHSYREEAPLDCPITSFGGLQDGVVDRASLEPWSMHTSAGFDLQMLPGNHIFLESTREPLLEILSKELCASRAEVLGPA